MGAASEFDAGPLAADGGSKGMLAAGSVFLEVSATHDFDDFPVGAFGIEAARIKAMDIGMPPEPEGAKPRPTLHNGGPLHQDIMAAVPAFFASTCDLVGRWREGLDDLLSGEIEP